MTPGFFLAKRHGIEEYKVATKSAAVRPSGFIYVETDRYLPSAVPDITDEDVRAISAGESGGKQRAIIEKLTTWAHEPLEELKFLRRIVEGAPKEGDGFQAQDSDSMVGCVIWAPFHLPTTLFNLYLSIAERVSGPSLWDKVVGFRYLLQGIEDENTLRALLDSKDWRNNILRLRSGRQGKGWTFDIGVDTHGAGVWQLEAATHMVEQIRGMEETSAEGGDATRVRFILNHLCKPDLSTPSASSFPRWRAALERLGAAPHVYMKLSGAFNEFAPAPAPDDVDALVGRLDVYTRVVFDLFGSRRVMFGSDWPVCNIGGPRRGDQNWGLWRDVVEKVAERHCPIDDGGEAAMADVWSGTGCEAYGVELR
jgi:L-rhamnono-1,4-lactonase